MRSIRSFKYLPAVLFRCLQYAHDCSTTRAVADFFEEKCLPDIQELQERLIEGWGGLN